jgi:hypothetical protein
LVCGVVLGRRRRAGRRCRRLPAIEIRRREVGLGELLRALREFLFRLLFGAEVGHLTRGLAA